MHRVEVSKAFPRRLIVPIIVVASIFAPGLNRDILAQGVQAALSSASNARILIAQPVNEMQLTTLKGNTHPLARPQFDLGTAPATLPMERMLLVLKRSPEQEAALDQLLDDQQDKSSPRYHEWLTPEAFGKQFGPTDADLQTIAQWLQSHGFQVGSTKGRTVLEFSGSASQVQEAFHTTIHKYVVNGGQYWANATDPQIPTALAPAIAGVASLNNFPRKAMNVPAGTFSRNPKTGRIVADKPFLTFPGGCVENNQASNYCSYGVTPYDFATIYNALPLWNAGINGAGVTIAIVGETDIQLSDVQAFRSYFGLPTNDPVFIWNGPDPGIQGDESEADIDVQWSGGVAPGATIDFVISQSTETSTGTDLSAVYIVDQNLAPIMSESYGECELGLGTAGNAFYDALWQQASAQGITVFISAGDNGSAGCDNFDAQSPAPAQYGLQVSGYASTPYNVAVGGTDFNDFSNPGTYWSTTNNATTQESALSYIPETTWNDSCTNALFTTVGFSSNPEANCNNSQLTPYYVVPVGGSGGSSTCTTNDQQLGTCSGGYPRPSWQSGNGGFSSDGKRDLPDVSLFASNGFVGNSYLICEADANGDCPYSFLGFGGTSVSSPAFAGIMALINQKTGERQGNANYVFYKLAQKAGASCTSSSPEGTNCIFNDVVNGTNEMPCATGSPNCVTNTSGDAYGVLSGYNAGTGYDMATGLGSVNANNLVNQWSSVSTLASVTALNSLAPTTITHGQAVNFNVTVTPKSGTGTPTGTISLLGGPANSTQGIGGFNLTSGAASGSTDMLPGGTYSVTAYYPGDANYASSGSSALSVTVNKENSQPQLFLVTFNSNGQIVSSNTNTAVYGSPYLLRVNVENAAGQLCNPVATSGATACPTGTVAMTDNGAALDAGTYTLNSYGYFEDQIVQLPGGTDSIKASYAGDNSFNSSSVTTALTITPASTTTTQPYVNGASVGQPTSISVYVNTTTTAVAPSGTVTFYANGNVLQGTVAYDYLGNDPPAYSNIYATLISNSNVFPTSGNYSITATYNGDANYSASTSPAVNINVKYPVPNLIETPQQQTASYGSTATITTLVDTTNKSAYPTGTVLLSDAYTGTTIAGPTSCANATDTSGNFACQVVSSFTVTSGDPIYIAYSGDSNYPPSTSSAYISMPDFQVFPVQGGFTITAGQSQSVQINFNSINGFSGTVANLACSGLPAETSCTFSPTQVTIPSNGSVSTTLTVTTTAIGQARQHIGLNKGAVSGLALLFGACIIFFPVSRGRGRNSIGLLLVLVLIFVPACGGGGGVGGTPNPVPSISSLSPAQVAAGSQVENLYINGSNFINSSTVTLNGSPIPSSLQSPTQLQIPLVSANVATTGQYPVVVTNPSPGGGASSPVNFQVVSGTPTGIFTFTFTATAGPITHTTTMNLTVQ